MKIYLDKKFVDCDKKTIVSLAPVNLSGRGGFETMRVLQSQIVAFDKHWARLSRGLRILKIKNPLSQIRAELMIKKLLVHTRLKDARIRLVVWQQKNQTRVSILSCPYKTITPQQFKKGYRVIISAVKRPLTMTSHVKSIKYHCFDKAYCLAQEAGCDEAILLNHSRKVVEGSRTNVFFVHKGIIYTPKVNSGCINGITRQIVMEVARQKGYSLRPIDVTVRQLLQADEVFLTNSILGIMPVHSIGDVVFKGNRPWTKALKELYENSLQSFF